MSTTKLSKLPAGLMRLVPNITVPQKLRGGRLEKWANYWKDLAFDYTDSMATIGQQMKERPVKAGIYLTLCGAAVYLTNTNPTEEHLKSRLVEIMNDSALMGEAIRNKTVDGKLNHVIDCHNNDTLRRLNLILFSLAWEDNYHSECAHYKATISHLKPRYMTFFQERVLDVGFLGTWWGLEERIRTMDINDEEWDELGNRNPEYAAKKSAKMGLF